MQVNACPNCGHHEVDHAQDPTLKSERFQEIEIGITPFGAAHRLFGCPACKFVFLENVVELGDLTIAARGESFGELPGWFVQPKNQHELDYSDSGFMPQPVNDEFVRWLKSMTAEQKIETGLNDSVQPFRMVIAEAAFLAGFTAAQQGEIERHKLRQQKPNREGMP